LTVNYNYESLIQEVDIHRIVKKLSKEIKKSLYMEYVAMVPAL